MALVTVRPCQDQAEAAAAVGEPGGLSDAQRGVHLGLSLALAASADRWRAGEVIVRKPRMWCAGYRFPTV